MTVIADASVMLAIYLEEGASPAAKAVLGWFCEFYVSRGLRRRSWTERLVGDVIERWLKTGAKHDNFN